MRILKMLRNLLVLCLIARPALGETTAASVAKLVQEKDAAALAESLRQAAAAPEPLVRATAARVIAVRNVTALLPLLRDTLRTETDATAAREQIRALAMLGEPADLEAALSAASRWPAGMDDALAIAVARRGGPQTIDIYLKQLRSTRMANGAEFFRVALWARGDLLPLTGSRLIGAGDERGWRALLDALRASDVSMNAPVLVSSLGAPSEDIRTASIWYLIRGYATAPEALPPAVVETLAQPAGELSTNREDFGREILRRMTGGEKKDDPRWLKLLETDEGSRLFTGNDDALQYVTDAEYELLYTRCALQPGTCAIPEKRTRRTIPSQTVRPAVFNLPETLPAGLADAIVQGGRCNDWLGVADVTVDSSGRIQAVDLGQVSAAPSCRRALDTLLRLSLATNTSMRSGFHDGIVLVHARRTPLCLDEPVPADTMTSVFTPGGDIVPPQALRRVEPQFPETTRKTMGSNRNVLIQLESVITKEGCVRSLRPVRQSPFPELNGAALMALSQWTFAPGRLNGKPVDVMFNLTINYSIP
ncbi:MAG TPA: energy transducer TonB [Thermoanaerobaculia bacterium]|nr:energy transducer TonB [Thermoanaerobaculia bacterium]